MGFGRKKGKIIKNIHVPFFSPSPSDKWIYHPVFWNINTLEVKGFKFWCQQFLIASVIQPTSVSPSWWRWWHCSCCLCIASRAWRRHLSGIPARPYPAEDGKADRTLLTALALRTLREGRTSPYRCTRGKISHSFFNASLQNVQGDFTPPTLVFTQCTGNLWCCSMRWNSSTRCSSAPFQTGRRTLNKQWPSSLINIDILPCKAKTNSLKQNFCYGPKDWLMGQTISSESHQLEEKKRLKCVIVRWRTQHDPKKAAWSLNTVIVSCVSDMKSIWKSSDLFLLHSVEELSKARRRGEKNMSGYRLELLFSPEGHIKRSFDPKLKLNKGPNTQWLKKQLFWGF